MTNFIVCIGNSDNKLTQHVWSLFVNEVCDTLETNGDLVTELFTAPDHHQQSAWFVIDLRYNGADDVHEFLSEIRDLACRYNQESIAVFEQPTTHFVRHNTDTKELLATIINAASSQES